MKKIKRIITRENLKKSLYNLNLNDPNLYKEVNSDNAYNLFQITGKAYKEISAKIKPKNWEEVNACNAMARPGTINFLDDYLNGKRGVKKYNDKISNLLKDTQGICIYQESAMSIFVEIGGFSLEEADQVRGIMKRLSKKDKKPEDLERWKEIVKQFKEGAKKQGISEKDADLITNDLVNFSSYSFNKCFSGDMKINGITIRKLFELESYKTGLSLNYNTKELFKNDILDICFSGIREVYEIKLENNEKIEVTDNHDFPTEENGKIIEKCLLTGLNIGDILFSKNGKSIITSIIPIGRKDTYDIEMQRPYHTICVNNIVAKNSHCYGYSYIGMITAYLSYYHRTKFYCSSLNFEEKTDDIIKGLNACRLNGIKILPPDINDSGIGFTTHKDKEITFGLLGIKGVGEKALEQIVNNRPYENFKDFITNPNCRHRAINSKVMSALICTGCFDKTDGKENRRKLLNLSKIFWTKRKSYKIKEKLLEVYDISLEELNVNEKLNFPATFTQLETWENEFLGYNFFTSKFTDELFEKLDKSKMIYRKNISDIITPAPVLVLVKNIRTLMDKNNKEMAFVSLVDSNNMEISIPFFSSFWPLLKKDLIENKMYIMILRKQNGQIYFGRANYIPDVEIKKSLIKIPDDF